MTILTVQYTLPSYLAGALFYGDLSNFTDDELGFYADWFDEKVVEHGGIFHCVDCEDYGFCHNHDYDSLGADCQKFTFHVNEV